MTRWLVTGAGGALGSDVVSLLADGDQDVVGLDRHALDVSDDIEVASALATTHPDIVINAAAWTRVDDAETQEAAAARINGEAPGAIARWCTEHNTRLIHVSTDYVFAGDASSPYEVDAATEPLSAYGRTKLAGERAALAAGGDVHVVRTSWLYGERGSSFIRTVGGRLLAGDVVDVVDDQRGAPTWTRDLAQRLVVLGTAAVPPGVLHCTAAGEATWFGVAIALAELLGRDPAQVRPTTTAAMARPARRPAYSVLSNQRWQGAGLPPMPQWRDALSVAVDAVFAE